MADFKQGDKVRLINGDTVTIKSKIGEGGQGCVYKVEYKGKEYALKWYLPNYLKSLKNNCKKFYKNLTENVTAGSPSPKFLWMKAVAITGKHSNGFGYIMNLRPQNYDEFTKYMKAKVFFKNTEAVINAAINVVEAFQALHRKGYSYQDLSPCNFFIDKVTGDVLICDNDNVSPNNNNLGIGGTPGYMAPEVILGNSKPGTDTDLFSLSVILFELFFLSHPLEGANCCKHPCLTPQIEKDLYAIHPVFVMSKTDKSNSPARGTCSNLVNLWPIYPEYLHEAFQHAFSTECLQNGTKRLTEKEWKEILYHLKDDSVVCSYCGEINFASMGVDGCLHCTECHRKQIIPYALKVNEHIVVAGKGKQLTEYHTIYGDRNKAIGNFVESKKTSGVFGITNVSNIMWTVTYPDKPAMKYDIGKTVTLIPDTIIDLGNMEITVVSMAEKNK